jgi:hypothetical protein
MKTLLAAILFLGICILAMCVGIIVKGRFPETEVSRNEEMRKRGIKCMHELEQEMLRNARKNADCTTCSDSCQDCGFYRQEFGDKHKA